MIKKRNYLYKNKKVLFVLKIIDFFIDLLPIKKNSLPKEVNKILLIKPDHLGDVLLLTSVLPLIKEKYPNIKIDIIIGSWAKVILYNNPYINNIYEINHFRLDRSKKSVFNKLLKFLKDYFGVLQDIRQNYYDISINFRSYGDNLITLQLLSKSKYNIAYGSAGFGGLLDCELDIVEKKHEVEYFLDLLAKLAIKEDINNLHSFVSISKDDKQYVKEIVNRYKLKDFIIIHPGSGDTKKMKDSVFWEEIIKCHKETIVFCGTKDEKYLIKDLKNKNILDLMGIFSISQLVEFYKKAKLIYTVDSLAGHLASITDTKTISFYSDFTDTIRWKPLGSNVKVIKNHNRFLKDLKSESDR